VFFRPKAIQPGGWEHGFAKKRQVVGSGAARPLGLIVQTGAAMKNGNAIAIYDFARRRNLPG
jgi:hypothetical protein